MKKEQDSILVLENIRSAQNVGSIFRTADAVGISKIILVGDTPHPIDRFGRERKDIVKSALGAEKYVPWEGSKNVTTLLKKYKNKGFYIIAIEQSKNSRDYKSIKARNKNVFVCGNEVKGVSEKVLKLCDAIAEISQRGGKESLNVSVAVGVVLFRILDI